MMDTLLVIAAFFAGFVALAISIWGRWLASLFFYPDLKIEYSHCTPDATKIPTSYPVQVAEPSGAIQVQTRYADFYYFRFRVKNQGNVTAKKVEVFVKKLEERQAMCRSC